jgi:copper chaperone CopZ
MRGPEMCDSCSCGTTDSATTTTASDTATGMTCAHCVSSVTSEVGQIAGVRAVDADLDSGAVTVTSD